jgi:hypothetical protein
MNPRTRRLRRVRRKARKRFERTMRMLRHPDVRSLPIWDMPAIPATPWEAT